MKLSEKQQIFALNIAKLILWANENGFAVTFGESFNSQGTGHMKNSLHYIRLAQDLNLFINGVYQTGTDAHRPLGDYWKTLHPDNAWGGDFHDGNHYSMRHDGRA